MEDIIRREIERKAKSLLDKHQKKIFTTRKYEHRYRVRTGEDIPPEPVREPGSWSVHPHFNPKYCLKNSKYLARVIWQRIIDRQYNPQPAIKFDIPKKTGGFREIMSFTVPDAAIANLFNKRLRDRNRNILSPFCYSYRPDRGVFDAILQLNSFLSEPKTYVTQFDFSKYFDSIKHDYIKFVLDQESFVVSPLERFLIEKFLTHQYAKREDYVASNFRRRSIGTPQGCSLSLFLANVAGHELDRQLERKNGSFVRFADDVVCVSNTHADALDVLDVFKQHGHYSGIEINHEKSPGIKLMSSGMPSYDRRLFLDLDEAGPIRKVKEIDYLGHKFRGSDVLLATAAIGRVKARISRIIYIHLLQNPRTRDLLDPGRIVRTYFDWDLVTCINEIRRYIYGGLRESQIRAFLDDNVRVRKFQGLMSFYPLVTEIEQFKMLDGWMLSVLRRALKERYRHHYRINRRRKSVPNKDALISGHWYNGNHRIMHETSAPSFVLAWRAARKSFRQYGLVEFEAPSYYSAIAGSHFY